MSGRPKNDRRCFVCDHVLISSPIRGCPRTSCLINAICQATSSPILPVPSLAPVALSADRQRLRPANAIRTSGPTSGQINPSNQGIRCLPRCGQAILIRWHPVHRVVHSSIQRLYCRSHSQQTSCSDPPSSGGRSVSRWPRPLATHSDCDVEPKHADQTFPRSHGTKIRRG